MPSAEHKPGRNFFTFVIVVEILAGLGGLGAYRVMTYLNSADQSEAAQKEREQSTEELRALEQAKLIELFLRHPEKIEEIVRAAFANEQSELFDVRDPEGSSLVLYLPDISKPNQNFKVEAIIYQHDKFSNQDTTLINKVGGIAYDFATIPAVDQISGTVWKTEQVVRLSQAEKAYYVDICRAVFPDNSMAVSQRYTFMRTPNGDIIIESSFALYSVKNQEVQKRPTFVVQRITMKNKQPYIMYYIAFQGNGTDTIGAQLAYERLMRKVSKKE